MKLFKIMIIISLAIPVIVVANSEFFKQDYDYPNQGEDWYGNPNHRTPWMDYGVDNNIPTQQGDDYCFGHEKSLINIGQGPEMSKTNAGLTAYEYYREGGSLCLNYSQDPNDLIFLNGFE